MNTCADRGGEGDDECDYCGERDFLWVRVIWAGRCPVSGSVFRRGARACVLRGQGGGAVRGFNDRRRAADDDGRVAQRVSSAAWASAAWPMAGRGGRAISRAGYYNVVWAEVRWMVDGGHEG